MTHNLKNSKLVFYTERIKKYFFLVFLILFNINSGFSQIIRTEISDVIKKSDFITRAQVVSAASEWKNDSRGRHIYTICKMKTLENYKGNNGEYFTVELIGGTVGEETETVIPSITLTQNEDVILFLEGNQLKINDLSYGKIPVTNDQVFLENETINVSYFSKAINEVMNNPLKYRTTNDFIMKINSFKKSFDSTVVAYPEFKTEVISKGKKVKLILKNDTTSLPNLTFIQPDDWPEKIILSNKANTRKSDTLYASNTLFIDFCLANTGDTTAGSFYISCYLDNVLQAKFAGPSVFQKNATAICSDLSITDMIEGDHILRLVVDIQDFVKESNEQDNEVYVKFHVNKPFAALPVITSVTPLSASANTNSQVTIQGVNFGNSVENSAVNFFNQRPASIISWSKNKITCTVPFGSMSGSVSVTVNTLVSNKIDFSVPFGFLSKWNLSPLVVKYKINANYTDANNVANEIITAANSWSLKRSNFRLQYDGATNALSTSHDNINEILFEPSAQSYIGVTISYTKNNNLTETDISFNTRYIFGTNLESNKYDLRTVAVHELGHVVGLDDLYGYADSNKIMYGYGRPGLIKRTITPDDSLGLFWIYGSRSFPQCKISGKISADGLPLSGASVTLSGDKDSTVLTGTDGGYSFLVDSSFNYTITPSKAGYMFSSTSKTYTEISGSLTQDFTAVQTAATNIISGIITYNGIALNNVTVNLTGSGNKATVTDLSGKYSLKAAINGNYTITPYKAGYYFSPHSISYTRINTDQIKDFSAYVTNISQAPVLVSPFKDYYGIGTTYNFYWNELLNVTGYELQLSTDNTFTNIVSDYSGISDFKQAVNNLAPNTTFYWRVRGENGKDQGNWSEVWNFKTAVSALSKPILTYPSNNSTVNYSNILTNLKLKWTSVEGASSYDVMISNKQDMSDITTLYQFLELPSVSMRNPANNKTYYWKALARKELTTGEWSEIYSFAVKDVGCSVNNSEDLPESYSLSQNYPNPFNPSTTIQYSIVEPAFVTIKIFDVYGREVETLVNKNLPVGRFSTTWEPRKITSGVYYYKIVAGKYNEVRKMIYLK
jgi:hypothetical protein